MNQRDRKSWILERLASAGYINIFAAMDELSGELNSLEAVPIGLRNRPTELLVDLTDGRIDGPESIKQLVAFVHAIPDHA